MLKIIHQAPTIGQFFLFNKFSIESVDNKLVIFLKDTIKGVQYPLNFGIGVIKTVSFLFKLQIMTSDSKIYEYFSEMNSRTEYDNLHNELLEAQAYVNEMNRKDAT